MGPTFGEYIRSLRKEKGLTLTQLAALLGLDSANLSKIENGKRVFDEKRLNTLTKTFKLDYDEVKSEYYSEIIAQKMYLTNCNNETLILAEQKVKYLKQKNSKQINIKFS